MPEAKPQKASADAWAARMRADWEARASRSPHWFVDARTDFDQPEVDAFVQRGKGDLLRALQVTGYAFRGDESVLELGCGMGRMTGAIADRAGRVVGVDISEGMLAHARQAVAGRSDVALVRTDGVSLAPLRDRSFDLVVCNAVYQHLPSIEVVESYTREIGRVLRPGHVALVGLQSWTLSPYRWLRAAVAWTLDYLGFRRLGVYSRTFLGVRLNERRVRDLFAEAGMAVEGYWPLPDHRAWVRARRP